MMSGICFKLFQIWGEDVGKSVYKKDEKRLAMS